MSRNTCSANWLKAGCITHKKGTIPCNILWFPFNLLAKESNYSNALIAANQRILIMHQLKKDKNCPEQQIAQQKQNQQSLDTKIRELNQLYKDGLLTETEYLVQKKKVLDSI